MVSRRDAIIYIFQVIKWHCNKITSSISYYSFIENQMHITYKINDTHVILFTSIETMINSFIPPISDSILCKSNSKLTNSKNFYGMI